MKLQLNTGKTLKFWYVPQNIDFETGVASGETVIVGPMELELTTRNSILFTNFSLVVTASSVNVSPPADNVSVRILKNSNSTTPIYEELFYFTDESDINHININILDSNPLSTNSMSDNVTYTIILSPTFQGIGITSSYTINSINFAEIEAPTELAAETS